MSTGKTTFTASELGALLGRTKQAMSVRARLEGWPFQVKQSKTGSRGYAYVYRKQDLPPDIRLALKLGVKLSELPPAERRSLAELCPALERVRLLRSLDVVNRQIAFVRAQISELQRG